MKTILLAGAFAAVAAASPAAAATNLITNGSFEAAGTTGTGAFNGWSKLNTPSNTGGDVEASVIVYNSNASYPTSAFGDAVAPDNVLSASPDAVGNFGAYFVGDFSVNETIFQDLFLTPGRYRVGFSYYLPANGLANPGNANIKVSILGVKVAETMITGTSPGTTWLYATGVGKINFAGTYRTAITYNTNFGGQAKDVVIDRVFGIPTTDLATVVIPPAFDSVVPEPATWALLLVGFGMVGTAARRRHRTVAA